ncbi:MAG: hypothetical protein JO332_03700 [Planctomycetaceae bacterium]|nr:hypothetical protein [Planctomycetaceae bacterium]
MRVATLFAALVALAGCAAPSRPLAQLTIYGPELRLDSWTPLAVERGHVHADLAGVPCPLSAAAGIADALKSLPVRNAEQLSEQMTQASDRLMNAACAVAHGPAYGGADRLVLVLARLRGDPETVDEALLLDFPRLKPGETERRFDAGSFKAAWERPPKSPVARLERGWARIRRLDADRYEFELFLVLAPSDGSGTPTQVVARVAASTRPQ